MTANEDPVRAGRRRQTPAARRACHRISMVQTVARKDLQGSWRRARRPPTSRCGHRSATPKLNSEWVLRACCTAIPDAPGSLGLSGRPRAFFDARA